MLTHQQRQTTGHPHDQNTFLILDLDPHTRDKEGAADTTCAKLVQVFLPTCVFIDLQSSISRLRQISCIPGFIFRSCL